jgi:hypothetical protein
MKKTNMETMGNKDQRGSMNMVHGFIWWVINKYGYLKIFLNEYSRFGVHTTGNVR